MENIFLKLGHVYFIWLFQESNLQVEQKVPVCIEPWVWSNDLKHQSTPLVFQKKTDYVDCSLTSIIVIFIYI